VPSAVRYAIGELAALGGVSRRTVRYYVQEGLIPPPLGVGRGDHYSADHLEQLLRVKAMQESGRTLDEIRRALGPPGRLRMRQSRAALSMAHASPPLPRALWRRLMLAPGVELHVASTVRLPSPGKLQELADLCRTHFADAAQEGDERDEDPHA
jgi:DNA-binding transcriptional MerR regulator